MSSSSQKKGAKRPFIRMSNSAANKAAKHGVRPTKDNVADKSHLLDDEDNFDDRIKYCEELGEKSPMEGIEASLALGKDMLAYVGRLLDPSNDLYRRKKYPVVDDDISHGEEKIKIPVINEVDDERTPALLYMGKIKYPEWLATVSEGCDCVDGCSDLKKCMCVLKNGGRIPYNKKGLILSTMPLVHECGPKCKCPSTCLNRVSQHGIRFQLEVFKTESKGWGARSRDHIPCGGFICEYIGEILDDRQADQRIGRDGYLFDISVLDDDDDDNEKEEEIDDDGGYSIDGQIWSNVGRFLNHSCDPNVYTQEVMFDYEDKRIPHIMFFALKDISPMEELVYNYGYKDVRDANGNVRTKECFCGARKCKGKMY